MDHLEEGSLWVSRSISVTEKVSCFWYWEKLLDIDLMKILTIKFIYYPKIEIESIFNQIFNRIELFWVFDLKNVSTYYFILQIIFIDNNSYEYLCNKGVILDISRVFIYANDTNNVLLLFIPIIAFNFHGAKFNV